MADKSAVRDLRLPRGQLQRRGASAAESREEWSAIYYLPSERHLGDGRLHCLVDFFVNLAVLLQAALQDHSSLRKVHRAGRGPDLDGQRFAADYEDGAGRGGARIWARVNWEPASGIVRALARKRAARANSPAASRCRPSASPTGHSPATSSYPSAPPSHRRARISSRWSRSPPIGASTL